MSLGTRAATPVGTAGLDVLRDQILTLTEKELEAYLTALTATERRTVSLALCRPALLPHQVAPHGTWEVWLMMAGRGAGKTQAASVWFDQHMTGPPCDDRLPGGHLGLIVAPTQADAVAACYEGPSGLKYLNPTTKIATTREGTIVQWPSGAKALMLGAHSPDDVDRFRASGNRCVLWAEELAAWRKLQDAWDVVAFGLRTVGGAPPRIVASTTPRNKPVIKALRDDPATVVTTAGTKDNPHLNAERRRALYAKYGGTRLGRQELEGELIEDIEGALWSTDNLDLYRVEALPCDAVVKVIGVDPTGGRAECGIIAAAKGRDGHFYVTADYSLERPSPASWGAQVVDAYATEMADRVAVERNYGGDMVRHVVLTSAGGESIRVKDVNAARGKAVRAEPVANLFTQGRAHIVGYLPELEAQMTTWVADSGETSPDRMDAMVWAVTEMIDTRDTSSLLAVSPGGVTSPSYWKGDG